LLAVSVGTSMLSASSPAADSCVFAVSSTAANSCAAPSLRMTIATAQPVKVLTDALSDHAADAHTLVSDLTAGLNALADGSEIPESNEDIHELLTALNTLFDGAAQLKDGSTCAFAKSSMVLSMTAGSSWAIRSSSTAA